MPTAVSELLSKTNPPLEDASIVATAARARPTRAHAELAAERIRVNMDGTPHAGGKRSAMGRGGNLGLPGANVARVESDSHESGTRASRIVTHALCCISRGLVDTFEIRPALASVCRIAFKNSSRSISP